MIAWSDTFLHQVSAAGLYNKAELIVVIDHSLGKLKIKRY